jgi:hypothetical protein
MRPAEVFTASCAGDAAATLSGRYFRSQPMRSTARPSPISTTLATASKASSQRGRITPSAQESLAAAVINTESTESVHATISTTSPDMGITGQSQSLR